jgi:Na+/H+ antiporter NhaD/arsenite permease-like protein
VNGIGAQLSWWWVTPFAGLLLCIAVMPLVIGEWFDKHINKGIVAFAFGAPTLVYLLMRFGTSGDNRVLTTAQDYVSFIVLLAALFTITGGIYLTGNLLGTPLTNVVFLGVGAVLASFMGTTGAAMVLIRPLLRTNSERRHTRHIFIFATFIVCNLGGLLTPLGDPPLFLGFLNGVSFSWTFRLWPQWLLANGLVLIIFFALDSFAYRKEETRATKQADLADYEPIGIKGKLNLLFLAGVIGAVLASEPLKAAGEVFHFPFLREVIMVALMALSLQVGSQEGRQLNRFTWGPIREVAIIFAGIFAAMIPALALLEARGASIGLSQPWHFFWASGGLSSFLDNAPTYLTFTAAAQGRLGIGGDIGNLMSTVVSPAAHAAPSAFLAAISCGSVFMGANSYIGNAPNFMVKTMAEEAGVNMPNFFGYMAYSGVILIPIFAIITFVFFL